MAKRLNQARCLVSSSNTVPFVLPTERDSNSLNHYSQMTYDVIKKEYCNEEGCFRGAFPGGELPPDSRFNTKRRERELSAFRVIPLRHNDLRQPAPKLRILRLPAICVTPPIPPTLGASLPQDSRDLGLTDPFGLDEVLVRQRKNPAVRSGRESAGPEQRRGNPNAITIRGCVQRIARIGRPHLI